MSTAPPLTSSTVCATFRNSAAAPAAGRLQRGPVRQVAIASCYRLRAAACAAASLAIGTRNGEQET